MSDDENAGMEGGDAGGDEMPPEVEEMGDTDVGGTAEDETANDGSVNNSVPQAAQEFQNHPIFDDDDELFSLTVYFKQYNDNDPEYEKYENMKVDPDMDCKELRLKIGEAFQLSKAETKHLIMMHVEKDLTGKEELMYVRSEAKWKNYIVPDCVEIAMDDGRLLKQYKLYKWPHVLVFAFKPDDEMLLRKAHKFDRTVTKGHLFANHASVEDYEKEAADLEADELENKRKLDDWYNDLLQNIDKKAHNSIKKKQSKKGGGGGGGEGEDGGEDAGSTDGSTDDATTDLESDSDPVH